MGDVIVTDAAATVAVASAVLRLNSIPASLVSLFSWSVRKIDRDSLRH
jgi:hypothetical protein